MALHIFFYFVTIKVPSLTTYNLIFCHPLTKPIYLDSTYFLHPTLPSICTVMFSQHSYASHCFFPMKNTAVYWLFLINSFTNLRVHLISKKIFKNKFSSGKQKRIFRLQSVKLMKVYFKKKWRQCIHFVIVGEFAIDELKAHQGYFLVTSK